MTKARPLPSQEELKRLLDYDPETGVLTWKARTPDMFKMGKKSRCDAWNTRYAGKPAMTAVSSHGYRVGLLNGRLVMAHRVAFKIMTGADPEQIDHIDQDKTNNEWGNLKETNHSKNARNRRRASNNTSGTPGVCYVKRENIWRADCYRKPGQKILIGKFATKEQAVKARKFWERRWGYSTNHGSDGDQKA